MFDWLWNLLNWLGFGNIKATIIFLGLDNAGKTTLLQMLKTNKLVTHTPTQRPTSEELILDKLTLQAHDLGGHELARRLWQDYCGDADAIVFLVDTADPKRFEEAKRELDGLLSIDGIEKVPFLILGNKIDISHAVDEYTLKNALGINNQQCWGKSIVVNQTHDTNQRPMEIFMCSIVQRIGYREGFQWLGQFLNK